MSIAIPMHEDIDTDQTKKESATNTDTSRTTKKTGVKTITNKTKRNQSKI